MSGDDDSPGSYIWRWAHLLWQRKGLRMEDFVSMEPNVQLAYIASEELSLKNPLDAGERLAKVYIKSTQ